MASNRNLLVLPGDGIGPEVMAEVRKIIAWMGKKRAIGFDIQEDVVGGAELADAGEVAGGRDDDAGLALDRLDEEADGVRGNGGFQCVGDLTRDGQCLRNG